MWTSSRYRPAWNVASRRVLSTRKPIFSWVRRTRSLYDQIRIHPAEPRSVGRLRGRLRIRLRIRRQHP